MSTTLLTFNQHDVICSDVIRIVDPANNKVLAQASGRQIDSNLTTNRPLLHAVMVGLDLLAKSQNGGSNLSILNQSSSDLSDFHGLFHHQYSSSDDYYIAKGLDVYLSHEPCVMCSMALLHSRVATVFYNVSTKQGGLGTLYKIHANKQLNHRFDVFCRVQA